MRTVILISTIMLSAAALSSSARADIYRYVDEAGVIHFTNVSPGRGYQKIITEYRVPSKKKYDHIIDSTSLKYNIEPDIIKAVITAESNWNPEAISHKGAIGLMQLMPSTAKDLEVSNPFDPEENIEGGTKYLRYLLNKFDGDLDLALAAYNAGPSAVEKSRGIPAIKETSRYVRHVKKIYSGKSSESQDRIYKVITKDGTILYTNSSDAHQTQ